MHSTVFKGYKTDAEGFKALQLEFIGMIAELGMCDIINKGFFDPQMEYPQAPKKPRLDPIHNSVQALNYAEALIVYEQARPLYDEARKHYNEKRAMCHVLFKWACFYDIGVFEHTFPCIEPPAIPATDSEAYGKRANYYRGLEKAWDMAWERGHSAGIYEVHLELETLNELLICF